MTQDRYWPDPELLDRALLDPKGFAKWWAANPATGFVDSRCLDLVERCARAWNTQDLLVTLEHELGAGHPFTADVFYAWWEYNERQIAHFGSRRGMVDPRSDAFLQSFEWRQLRWKFLQKHESRCQDCGRTPRDGIVINVDHVQPRKTHPHLALDPSNLQVLCNECNHGKGNSQPSAAARAQA